MIFINWAGTGRKVLGDEPKPYPKAPGGGGGEHILGDEPKPYPKTPGGGGGKR